MPLNAYVELTRLQEPVGFFLSLWPPLCGLTMAAYAKKMNVSDYGPLLVRVALATVILQSSGCTINDILDCRLDAAVERTKNRPIPSGRVSITGASCFLVLQYTIGLYVSSFFNKTSFYVISMLMVPLSCIYPLMKRITYWPQAWLGVCVNLGFMASWLAVLDTLEFRSYIPILMVSALWCWTITYDTVYACLDRKDDLQANVKSTALYFGNAVLPAVMCFASTFIFLLLISGILNGQGLLYFIVSVGGSGLFLFLKCMRLDVNSSASCWDFFSKNAYYLGLIMYSGLFMDYLRVAGHDVTVTV